MASQDSLDKFFSTAAESNPYAVPDIEDTDPAGFSEVDEGLNSVVAAQRRPPPSGRVPMLSNNTNESLKHRFLANMREEERYSLGVAAGRAIAAKATEGTEFGPGVQRLLERQQSEYDQLSSSDSLLEYAAAGAGALWGGIKDPVNFVYAPVRLFSRAAKVSRPIATEMIEQAVGASLFNAGYDTLTQGIRIYGGQQEEFSTLQLAASAGIGAVIGGGVGGISKAVETPEQRLASIQKYFEEDDPSSLRDADMLREEVGALSKAESDAMTAREAQGRAATFEQGLRTKLDEATETGENIAADQALDLENLAPGRERDAILEAIDKKTPEADADLTVGARELSPDELELDQISARTALQEFDAEEKMIQVLELTCLR